MGTTRNDRSTLALRRMLVVCSACFLFVYAQPLRADQSMPYQKCLAMLQDFAGKHREKGEYVKERHQSRLRSILGNATANVASFRSTEAELRGALRRLLGRSQRTAAWNLYIEKTIEDNTVIGGDPQGDTVCADRRRLDNSYDRSIDLYEAHLSRVEELVRHRIEIERLADDEGLVVIALNTNVDADEIFINRLGSMTGSMTIRPQRAGQHFEIRKAKAGRYNWNRITQHFYRSRRVFDFKEHDLQFTVIPGQLNYAGVLIHEMDGSWYSARIHDRTAIVMLLLEERYPELLQQMTVANGLNPDDPFIDFYISEMNARLQQEKSGD